MPEAALVARPRLQGAEPLAAAMADLISETERHLAAIEQLARRFSDLADGTWYENLDRALVPDDLIRRRLFSDPPA